MKKLTDEFVKNSFEQNGYRKLSPYVDCKTNIRYSCPQGHEGYITFDNFKRGKRCPKCRQNEASERYRHSYEKIKKEFEDAGCVLLSDVYRNGKEKQDYVCSCGNKATIRYLDFRRGERCSVCAIERRMRSRHGFTSSLQQEYIHSLIGGEQNYVFGNSCLDIAFTDKKIYVEYDGSGHDLRVKKGDLTKSEFEEKEKRRNYFFQNRGWKCIRFISRHDYLPTAEKILELFNEAMSWIDEGHSYCTFDFDKGVVRKGDNEFCVDFGELRRIRKS